MKKILHYLLRILTIFYIGCSILFFTSILKQSQSFFSTVFHLIFCTILIMLSVIAWRNRLAGGWLFILTGLIIIFLPDFKSWISALPAFTIGVLFWIGTDAISNKHRY